MMYVLRSKFTLDNIFGMGIFFSQLRNVIHLVRNNTRNNIDQQKQFVDLNITRDDNFHTAFCYCNWLYLIKFLSIRLHSKVIKKNVYSSRGSSIDNDDRGKKVEW